MPNAGVISTVALALPPVSLSYQSSFPPQQSRPEATLLYACPYATVDSFDTTNHASSLVSYSTLLSHQYPVEAFGYYSVPGPAFVQSAPQFGSSNLPHNQSQSPRAPPY
jgi:hypothetical protein